jgi:6-phosphogluconolactonase
MPDVRIVADPGELASVGAAEIVDGIRRAAGASRPFRIALAGGRTPRGVYERLAATDGAAGDGAVDWSRTHVFWGDERAVPPDDPDSNYRIPADRPDPGEAAAAYEREIRDAFHLAPGEWPRFDLVLLGLGEDGHVASLFPGSAAVEEQRHLVVAPFVERLGTHRISLTFPVINHAACVLFLVSGAAKAGILRAVIQGDDGPGRYPAQRVQPESGSVVWLVDRAAAARLSVHA